MFRFFIIIGCFFVAAFADYGDYQPGYAGYPNYQERIIHVWTNMCRTDPNGFRDTLIEPGCTGSQNILTAYPAQPPLYWNLNLNRSSRYHSSDMANNNCWGHNSCNGDSARVRLVSFYPGISWWGENIAAGNLQSMATMKQWIIEGTACPPPADGSGSDGHRANIMRSNFKELGVGYAYNASAAYDYYWTQDFAGNTSAYADRHLVSGSHDFSLATNKISFLLNYYDAADKSPTLASVVVAGTPTAMTRWMGTASRGTYRVDMTRGTACRNYYFAFTDGDGIPCRYPETGVLVTYGEGSCLKDYLPPESLAVDIEKASFSVRLTQRLSGRNLIIAVSDPSCVLLRTEVVDIRGRIAVAHTWERERMNERVLLLPGTLPAGVYFARHALQNRGARTFKLVLLK
ncbi:MAG: CAP domain-containing protein [Fibrobacterota bacterium]